MGSFYSHKCDHCNYEVQTDGPWAFYRDRNGKRKLYGRLPSQEAQECGRVGSSGSLYCSKCDLVSEMILEEFKKPKKNMDVGEGRLELKDEYKNNDAIKCPRCGNKQLLLGDNNKIVVECPRCKKGKFISIMTIIVD